MFLRVLAQTEIGYTSEAQKTIGYTSQTYVFLQNGLDFRSLCKPSESIGSIASIGAEFMPTTLIADLRSSYNSLNQLVTRF